MHSENTFIYVPPRAYHCGFKSAFNIAQAVNFADSNWLQYGGMRNKSPEEILPSTAVPMYHEVIVWKGATKFIKHHDKSKTTHEQISFEARSFFESKMKYYRKMNKFCHHWKNTEKGELNIQANGAEKKDGFLTKNRAPAIECKICGRTPSFSHNYVQFATKAKSKIRKIYFVWIVEKINAKSFAETTRLLYT